MPILLFKLCVFVKGYMHECRYIQGPGEDVISPGVGITGSCEPTVMGTEGEVH